MAFSTRNLGLNFWTILGLFSHRFLSMSVVSIWRYIKTTSPCCWLFFSFLALLRNIWSTSNSPYLYLNFFKHHLEDLLKYQNNLFGDNFYNSHNLIAYVMIMYLIMWSPWRPNELMLDTYVHTCSVRKLNVDAIGHFLLQLTV